MSVFNVCPRYEACSAPVCPIDPDYKFSQMLKDEPVCVYLRELSKPGGRERLINTRGERFTVRVQEAYDWCFENVPPIRKALKHSSGTASRITLMQAMKGSE